MASTPTKFGSPEEEFYRWVKTPPDTPCHTMRNSSGAPTLELEVHPDREYTMTLVQTRMVYDQLLQDKQVKLQDKLLQEKMKYDSKCNEMARIDKNRAMELAVWAQEQLNILHQENKAEMKEQREDYQEKLNKMRDQLEDGWQKKRAGQK